MIKVSKVLTAAAVSNIILDVKVSVVAVLGCL